MKIDPGWIQAVAALAALMAALYAVVTRPLLKRMDDIRADLAQFKTDTTAEFRAIRADTTAEFRGIRAELSAIHAELKLHGERLTRVEERLPPPLVRQ